MGRGRIRGLISKKVESYLAINGRNQKACPCQSFEIVRSLIKWTLVLEEWVRTILKTPILWCTNPAKIPYSYEGYHIGTSEQFAQFEGFEKTRWKVSNSHFERKKTLEFGRVTKKTYETNLGVTHQTMEDCPQIHCFLSSSYHWYKVCQIPKLDNRQRQINPLKSKLFLTINASSIAQHTLRYVITKQTLILICLTTHTNYDKSNLSKEFIKLCKQTSWNMDVWDLS